MTHGLNGTVKRGHVLLLNVVMERAERFIAKLKEEEEHLAEKYGGREPQRSARHTIDVK